MNIIVTSTLLADMDNNYGLIRRKFLDLGFNIEKIKVVDTKKGLYVIRSTKDEKKEWIAVYDCTKDGEDRWSIFSRKSFTIRTNNLVKKALNK